MFVCCTLTVLYSTYNRVDWSIAFIYDLSNIFTDMSSLVAYIGYRTPCHTIYITNIHNIGKVCGGFSQYLLNLAQIDCHSIRTAAKVCSCIIGRSIHTGHHKY